MKKLGAIPVQLKASIAFICASVITQGLSLLVTPIFVRIMDTAEIGVITNFNSWVTLIGIVVNMALHSSSYSIAMNEYSDERDQYTSFVLCVSMASTMIFSLIYLLFQDKIEVFLGIEKPLIWLMLLGFMFHPATYLWLARQRYEYKYISVLVVSVLSAVLSTVLAVAAVLYASKTGSNTVYARIFATYLITVSVGVFFSISIYCKGKTIIDHNFFKFIVVVNTPMIVHALAKNLLDVSDRVMISSMIGSSEAGIYGTLYSISMLIVIVWNAVNTAITPYMFGAMNQIDKKREELRKFCNIILVGFALIVVVFTLMAPEIISLFVTEEYITHLSVVPPIIGGCFVTTVYSMFGMVLLYNKKTKSVMMATLLAGIANILLNYFMIPKFGFHAAAYTTLVGYLVLAISMYVAMRRIKNKTSSFFDMRFFILILCGTVLVILLCVYLYVYVWIRYFCILIIVCVMFINKGKLKKTMMYFGTKGGSSSDT
mgnify:CR=1 FL=1